MPSTFDASWYDAYRRATVTPIVLVRMRMDLRRVLTVISAAAASAGDIVRITIGVTDYDLVAGTDFNISAIGEEEIAANIAAAWNLAEDNRAMDDKTGIRAIAKDYRTHFVGGAISSAFFLTSTDTAFADETYGTIPDLVFDNGLARIQHSFVSGDMPLFGYPCSIVGLSPASSKVDAFTRAVSIGAVDIQFGYNGADIRELAELHRMYLVHCDVLLGTPEIDEANFAPIGTFVVQEVRPEKGVVTLATYDFAEESWKNRTVRGTWVAQHPLQVAENLFSRVNALSEVDESTLDPSLYEDISHYNCSRFHDLLFGLDNAIIDDRKVSDIIEQLMFMCGGTFAPRSSDGQYEYNHFDFDRAIDRTWEHGAPGSANEGTDIGEEGIEVVESVGRIVNSVKITFANRGSGEDAREVFELTDESSRLTFGKRIESAFDLLWCNGYLDTRAFGEGNGSPQNSVNVARLFYDSTHLRFGYAARQGFCGARFDRVSNAWQLQTGADMGGATGRYCILLIKPPGRYASDGSGPEFESEAEYIAIDQWELLDNLVDNAANGLNVPSASSLRARIVTTSALVLDELEFGDETVYGRGGLGTTEPGAPTPDYLSFWRVGTQGSTGNTNPAENGYPQIVDVTIPIDVAKRILRRFRYGAPEIRVRTTLEHLDLNLGDFVAINGDDIFIGHQQVGLTDDIVWEIVGKQVDVMADSPGIVWDLVFVRDARQPGQIYGFVPPVLTLEDGAVPVSIIPEDNRYYFRDAANPSQLHIALTKDLQEYHHK